MTLQLSWNATENTIHSEQEAADSSLKMDGTGRVVPGDLVEGPHLMPSILATATSSFTATRAEEWAEVRNGGKFPEKIRKDSLKPAVPEIRIRGVIRIDRDGNRTYGMDEFLLILRKYRFLIHIYGKILVIEIRLEIRIDHGDPRHRLIHRLFQIHPPFRHGELIRLRIEFRDNAVIRTFSGERFRDAVDNLRIQRKQHGIHGRIFNRPHRQVIFYAPFCEIHRIDRTPENADTHSLKFCNVIIRILAGLIPHHQSHISLAHLPGGEQKFFGAFRRIIDSRKNIYLARLERGNGVFPPTAVHELILPACVF